MHYTQRMRDLREDKDLSQQEIAREINVAQTTYSDYENGKVRIPVDLLVSLAQYYNVDMNYMTGVSDHRTKYPR